MVKEGQANVRNSLIAGSMSGMVAKTLVAPLDRVKILYQVSNNSFSYKKGIDTAKSIINEHGLKGMWRGNSASLMRVVPYAAIQFTVHEQLKCWFSISTYEQKLKKPFQAFGAGALSGLAAVTFTYPLDVARARMATDNSYKNIYDVLKRSVLSKDRKFGLYRGFGAAVLGVAPYTGISFYIYELFKTRYFSQLRTSKDRASLAIQNILLGTMVSFMGQTVIYPLDVARRRLQTDVRKGRNFREIFGYIYKKEGFRGFYKGISLSWMKLPVVVGVSMATFDFAYHTLNKYYP